MIAKARDLRTNANLGTIRDVNVSQTDTVIEMRDLHKAYSDLEVIKGVSIAAKRGDVVSLIGSSGSGKSTLGLKLHKKLGLPLYHLDQYFWKPGWVEPDRAEWEVKHNILCDTSGDWIIEGISSTFFSYRAQKADILIFIDMPTYKCLYRVFKRALKNWGREYFASAKGCPERGPSWKFLKWVWNFNMIQKQRIEVALDSAKTEGKKVFIINNKQDWQKVIDNF